MLNKFNELFNKIIFENVQEDEQYNNFINTINDYDAFFHAYIEPLAIQVNIEPIKARYNVFRLYGEINNIINFFNKFNVDKQFMNDTNKFQFLNPMISLCKNQHKYNKISDKLLGGFGTEGETLNTYVQPDIETFNNQKQINKNIFGIWHDLSNYEEIKADKTNQQQQKMLTPKQTANKIKDFIKIMKIIQPTDIYIEFMVNADKLPNNSYEELAKAVPITDGNVTLSDIINNRDQVVKPQPNQNVLGTVDTSKTQNITKENNKEIKKSVKRKISNFDDKNKVKTKLKK